MRPPERPSTAELPIDRCSRRDFDQILREIDAFWNAGRAPRLFHPMFIEEFGDTAFVVRDGAQVAAHLFGFIATSSPTAYVHLVAVRRSHRRLGLAKRLYAHFAEIAQSRGCRRLKAITNPENEGSIAFHRRLGFRLHGEPDHRGVPVVRDYSGPGVDRVVMVRDLCAP